MSEIPQERLQKIVGGRVLAQWDDGQVMARELCALRVEVVRIRRILAVEQGDMRLVPSGWTYEGADDLMGERVLPLGTLTVSRISPGSYRWVLWNAEGDIVEYGGAPSALVAMETADAALQARGTVEGVSGLRTTE